MQHCFPLSRISLRFLEEAIASGILHDVLAELIDVIYLTLNLGQECGLEPWLDDAFVLKHSDNMRKQHESATHLSWTRTAHAKACKCSEETLKFTVSSQASGSFTLECPRWASQSQKSQKSLRFRCAKIPSAPLRGPRGCAQRPRGHLSHTPTPLRTSLQTMQSMPRKI